MSVDNFSSDVDCMRKAHCEIVSYDIHEFVFFLKKFKRVDEMSEGKKNTNDKGGEDDTTRDERGSS